LQTGADALPLELDQRLETLTRRIETQPEQTEARLQRGALWYQLGKYHKALYDFEACLAAEPNATEARLWRARTLCRLERWQAALEDLNRAQPLDGEGLLLRGKCLAQTGRYKEALQQFEELLQSPAVAGEAARNLAEVYFRLGQYATAAGWLTEALRAQPHNPRLLNDRGVARSRSGDPEAALKDFEQALQLEWSPEFLLNQALCLLQLERPAAARQAAVAALRIQPANPDAYYTIGLSELAEELYPAALKSFDLAIQLDPSVSWYFLGRAKARLHLGELYPAIEDINHVLEMEPDNWEADELLLKAYAELDRQNLQWLQQQSLPQTAAPEPQSSLPQPPSILEDFFGE